MKTLEINGKTYVKATALARELGYTSDYIGQLCRGGKVKAEQVGRSWYVEKDSITAHKENRYRSTAAKTKRDFKDRVREVHSSDAIQSPEEQAHTVHLKPHVYENDEAELIPTVIKDEHKREENKVAKAPTPKGVSRVPIAVEPSKSVTVEPSGTEYKIQVSERAPIRFTGTLAISGDDERLPPVKYRSVDEVAPETLPPKPKRIPREQLKESATVSLKVTSSGGAPASSLRVSIVLTTVVFLFVGTFFSLESRVIVADNSYLSQYRVDVSDAQNTIKSLINKVISDIRY